MTVEQLVRIQATRVAQVRGAVTSTVKRSWLALDDYRDADIARWVRTVSPVVQAGQVRTAALTDAYLAAYRSEVMGGAVHPVGVPSDVATGARGVPTAEVYARMGPEVWSRLADGLSIDEAIQAGLTRAVKVAATDMQLAKIHAADYVMSADDTVTSYRRVVNGKTCSLCISAADRTYYRGNLLPIHPGCDCGVQPVYGERPPVVNTSAELADDRGDIEINHHGELGLVLTVSGQHFEGPR